MAVVQHQISWVQLQFSDMFTVIQMRFWFGFFFICAGFWTPGLFMMGCNFVFLDVYLKRQLVV